MSKEFLSEVRDELESRSTRTSLSELRDRGLKQVRVIRSSQILQLIEDAVDQAIETRGLDTSAEERDALVASSQQVFQELASQQAQTQQQERKVLEAEAEVEATRKELEDRDILLQEALSRQAELDAELRMFHQRENTAAPEALLDELRALRGEINGASGAQAQVTTDLLNEKIADLGREIGGELERIGRKVGIAAADEAPSDLSAIFNSEIELESNLENVAAAESKGSDVSDALAKMKSLKGK